MTISEAAARTALSTHTLRYYESDGLLLTAIARSASGRRLYTEEDLAWILLVTRLRATGMPIRAIREYAALVRAGAGNEHERLTLLRAHRVQVLDRLREITDNLAAIDHKIDGYEERLAQSS